MKKTKQLPVIFLMGPTASGKTALAVQLVRALPCEIISVDSGMIYRGLDIGTAKPSPEILAEAPHHLINILDPDQRYSVADFREDACRLIEDIHRREKIPLLVGGTMMYFRALQSGLAVLPKADPVQRAIIEEKAKALGWSALHQELSEVDPDSANRIHPNDPQRIQRALEVYYVSGKSMSAWTADSAQSSLSYPVIAFGLMTSSREALQQRIIARVDQMLEGGWLDEARQLFQNKKLDMSFSAMRAVGYRQIWPHLENVYDYDAMRERIIIATRQLAKRQLTWLRTWPDLQWIENTEAGDLSKSEQDINIDAIINDITKF